MFPPGEKKQNNSSPRFRKSKLKGTSKTPIIGSLEVPSIYAIPELNSESNEGA